MPKRSDRLPWASYEGPDPEILLTPDDWRELEEVYGQVLVSEARDQLIEVANRYLFSVQPERNAAKIPEVKKISKELQKKFEPFISFAYGDRRVHLSKKKSAQPQLDDAYFEFESRYELQLAKRPLAINTAKLKTSKGPLPPDVKDYLENNNVSLELDTITVMNVALAIAVALDKIQLEIAENTETQNRPGFAPGRAFDTLLLELHEWAKKNKLRHAYRNGGKPGPLSELCFWLDWKFDPKYRENLASEEAVYDRWLEARKRRS